MAPLQPFWRQRKLNRIPDGIIFALALACLVREVIVLPVQITGISMLPRCQNGELGLVNKLAYYFREPRRGDLVAVRNHRELMIKRIVGLPGERIAIQNGAVYIDGQRLSEPYVRQSDHDDIGAGTLAAHNYMVIGDNRPATAVAVVNQKRILGRVVTLGWRIVARAVSDDESSP